MSAGAEGSTSTRAVVADPDETQEDVPGRPRHHHLGGTRTEPVLLEPQRDRWAWRHKIRSNPHQRRIYRVVVAVAGLLLVVLGLVSGPLPGPGGIPLVLLGLAVWASEFAWAHRVMLRFKHALHVFRTWSRPKQVVAWLVFFAACATFGYLYLLVVGLPAWMPSSISPLCSGYRESDRSTHP